MHLHLLYIVSWHDKFLSKIQFSILWLPFGIPVALVFLLVKFRIDDDLALQDAKYQMMFNFAFRYFTTGAVNFAPLIFYL